MTAHEYAHVRRLIEARALALRATRPGLHLADACTEVHRTNPLLWRLYQEGIRQGMPSEFLRPARPHAIPTPRELAWQVIEESARALVATSETPLILHDAVIRIVEARPDLYRAYKSAPKR